MSMRAKTTGQVVKSSGGGKPKTKKKGTKQRVQAQPVPAAAAHPVPAVQLPNGPIVVSGRQGFQTIFDPLRAAAIVEDVRNGLPVTFAAHRNNVKQSTVSMWLKRGEEEENSQFAGFAAAIREAQAEFVMAAITGIKDAGFKDARQWTALMTLIERIYPEHFRRPSDAGTNVNITNQIGVGVVEGKLRELHQKGELVYDGG